MAWLLDPLPINPYMALVKVYIMALWGNVLTPYPTKQKLLVYYGGTVLFWQKRAIPHFSYLPLYGGKSYPVL